MGLKMPRQLVIGPKGLLRTVAQCRYITQCIPLKHAMLYYIKNIYAIPVKNLQNYLYRAMKVRDQIAISKIQTTGLQKVK